MIAIKFDQIKGDNTIKKKVKFNKQLSKCINYTK